MCYIRKCPGCGHKIKYKSKYNFSYAERDNRRCAKCANSGHNNAMYGKKHSLSSKRRMSDTRIKIYQSEKGKQIKGKIRDYFLHKTKEEIYGKEKAQEIKNKISKKSKGNKNGFYGQTHSKETKLKISKQNKGRFLGDKNPMYGKPSPPGSGNGWSGWYKGWFFRSVKELSFMIKVIERFNLNWETGEKKEYAIPYVDHKGNKRNYFVDFIINNKFAVEIKPKKLWSSRDVELKQHYAQIWAQNRNMIYKIIDPKILTDNEIKILHENNDVIFTDKYENLFTERILNA